MKRRMLPLGMQSFRKLRKLGCYYVDKTAYIQELCGGGQHYFLSRPRRFGKSLFVNTLKELFEGNEPLFRGLDVHGAWGWSVQHPVIRLSFGYGHFHDPGYVHMHVLEQLADIAEAAGVESPHETGPGRLADLIRRLHRRSGHGVVVLVDEYDKPILDALEEPEVARANRDFLRGLYAVFKECDEEIRFTFITGVSKFSKSSLFSGLNNLEDITLDPLYSGICGYTEADLDEVFAPEMPGLDREEIRRWYNGYSWLGGECVYDPIDILLLLKKRVFKPYWVDTGTPKFLPELLFRRRVSSLDLERMAGDEELLSKFDVGEIGTEALLFQTGYLTITGKERSGWRTRYRLGYPNLEVRLALNARLLSEMVPEESWRVADHAKLGNLLAAGDLAGLKAKLRAVFASIPSDWHRRNQIARYEGYCAAVVHAWFTAQELDVVAEDSGSGGRADMVVRHPNAVYVLEFKVAETARQGTALAQIKAGGYAEKYLGQGRPVYLVGVEFGSESRNVERFDSERIQ